MDTNSSAPEEGASASNCSHLGISSSSSLTLREELPGFSLPPGFPFQSPPGFQNSESFELDSLKDFLKRLPDKLLHSPKADILEIKDMLLGVLGKIEPLLQPEHKPLSQEPLVASKRPRCALCHRRFRFKGVLTRHIRDQHFTERTYQCAWDGCQETFHRKDKLQSHCRFQHLDPPPGQPRPGDPMKMTIIEHPAPGLCPICAKVATSWDTFYTCLLSHCWADRDIDRVDSRDTGEKIIESPCVYLGGVALPRQKIIRTTTRMDPIETPKVKIENDEVLKSEEKNKTALSWPQKSTAESNNIDEDTCSVQSSIRTEITQQSENSPEAMDSESQYPAELEHLLNPTAYYDKLDELEAQIARMLCLEKDPNTHILTTSEAFGISEQNSDTILELQSKGFLNTLSCASRAISHLQTEGFCGGMFSIFVEDELHTHIANAVHISLDNMDDLNISPDMHATNIFRHIMKGKPPGMNPPSSPFIFNFLRNILPLALLSFTGSHVCRFDLSLWGQLKHDEIPVGLGLSFRPRELACLKDFIGGPVWVLGKARDQQIQEEGLKLSLSVQDLQELWGPVWLVGGAADEGPIIRTERGFIAPLPREEQAPNFQKNGEINCHWTKDVPEYIDREDRILLNGNSRILIGSDPRIAGGLAVNLNCKSQISYIQQQISHQFQIPGACNDYNILEGHEIPLTAGHLVKAGVNIKIKRMPGTTHKGRLLSRCCNAEADIWPVLSLRVGLEISACTGNARRITLWDALRLSQTKDQTQNVPFCNHEIPDPKCIQMCWTRLPSTAADSFSTMEIAPPSDTILNCPVHKRLQEKTLTKDQIRQAIVSSIQELEFTGIDVEGNLQAYWPFLRAPTSRRIVPTRFNKWLDILADTRDMSTFAVVSQRCLNFREGCAANESLSEICTESYRDPIQKTCLSLRVVPRPVSENAKPRRRFKIRLLTPLGSCLTDLNPGSAFRIGTRQLFVKKSWQCQQKIMVAYTSSKFDLSSKWTGVLEFKEELNPEIKGLEAIDVIICSKEYGDS